MPTHTRRAVLPVAAVVVLLVAGPKSGAAPTFSEWSAPVNLGPVVNSSFREDGPALSKDGLSLYFGSTRPGGSGGIDLWVSTRAERDAPWGAPVNLGPVVNSAATDNVPVLSRDGHWLFFNSTRGGGLGRLDIWASWREQTHDNFGWQAPVNLGPAVNSEFDDHGAGYLETEEGALLFFNSDRPGGQGSDDIYVSERKPDGSFGPPTLVAELNSPESDNRASPRFDGLELFLFSDRAGSLGHFDLWGSSRQTVSQAWSTPVNLGPVVNSAGPDAQPHVASDRRSLYFASNRPGGLGLTDLYVSTRTKVDDDD